MTQTPTASPETTSIEADEKLCTTCNAVIHKKAEMCPKCGVRQRKPANKAVLLLFTFFFGLIGIHRFYLGQWRGILYMLFFWTMIPALIALIEFIVFIFISSEKIEDNYTAHGSMAAIAAVLIIPIISIIGILAAVAIPAYMDYIHRAKVQEAIHLLAGLKTPAMEYISENRAFPPTVESLGGQTSGKYTANVVSNPDGLYFQATMSREHSQIGGKTVRLTLDPNTGNWICSPGSQNGLDNIHLPPNCRK